MIYGGNKNLKMRKVLYSFYIEIILVFSLKKQDESTVLLLIKQL